MFISKQNKNIHKFTFTFHKFPLGKAPGFNLITAEIVRKLLPKTTSSLYLYSQINSKTFLCPNTVEIPKPNKLPDIPSLHADQLAYNLFYLISVKLILEHVYSIIENNNAFQTYSLAFTRNISHTTKVLYRLES